MTTRTRPLRFSWHGGMFGAGAGIATEGFYEIAENWDGRFNIPGPAEVVDLTGIAAGYRVIKMLKSFDIDIVVTTNSTNTKVYRKETTWVERASIASRVATDAISFKNIIAIAFSGGNPYQFVTDTGSGALTFAASTKTSGNSEQATKFLEQNNGLLEPRVVYGLSPNEIYYTTDLTNTDGTGVLATYVGDTASTQNKITSLAEDNAGRVVVGMRHGLWTVDEEGIIERLTPEHFDDPPLDAGGQSDRDNFEICVRLNGLLFYNVEGYDFGAWDGLNRRFNKYMAPWRGNPLLRPNPGERDRRILMPRANLPINAACAAGGWLVLFMGTTYNTTLKDVTYYPGGNAHLASTFTANSEMWVGLPLPDGSGVLWHGILLKVSNPLRYAFYDEDDSYLYMASGASESADLQMTRCLFYTDAPQYHGSLVGAPQTDDVVRLTNETWKLEFGRIEFGDPWEYKVPKFLTADALGLSATATLEWEYKITPDYDSTAFESDFITWSDNHDAETGAEFDTGEPFRALHLRAVGTAASNAYAFLNGFDVFAELAPSERQLPVHR